jgi:uncharacterized membrane protein SpoIIM required for sporulation
MKEVLFIRQNTEKWQHYEDCLKNVQRQTPDELADVYVDLTNDLSFSRTYYPNSKVTVYLNNLSSKLHQFIYGRKKEKASRFVTYWSKEVPMVIYEARKELLYSFLIFIISAAMGVVSTANDENFVRLILGDQYVETTLENIDKNDPMAVYKSMDEETMFLGITLNNVWVSFHAFIAGIFTSIGSAIILINNGIMIGAFQYFFYERGLLQESFLTIWIHGTLEMSAIIIAGAAGITMGNSILFPGTYTRFTSFKRGAWTGMKIIVGTIPIFIIAGFLESFVTRHTHLPNLIRFSIILFSLFFVIYYFIVCPRILVRKNDKFDAQEN